MEKLIPLLLCDGYKTTHWKFYPKNTTKIVSYGTFRGTRIPVMDKTVIYGIQKFIKEYFIEYFNEHFFKVDWEVIVDQYSNVLDTTMGEHNYSLDNAQKLHKLGYLPIRIKCIKEGTRVDVKVPFFEITNTHDDFAWLTNALETLISCSIWHPMFCANVAYEYRKIVDEYYSKTVETNVDRSKALCNFDMRGQESLESATNAALGFLTSFSATATIPAIYAGNRYYGDKPKDIATSLPSTEHSVACSNFAVDGDEISLLRRMLTEIYPNQSFSYVSDSYDYWGFVKNVLPQLKDEILQHNGYMGCRGDSGDCVEVVTETVKELWKIFGGTINSKGYKVLDPHVKAVYGDSITVKRAKKIYEILENWGFACNNVVLGVGSFSLQAWENDDGTLSPATRDTQNFCIKATYCEIDGKPYNIFKDPKTDKDNFKKSQKGCCVVYNSDLDENGNCTYYYEDGKTYEETEKDPNNKLAPIFENGEMLKETTLGEIRSMLYRWFFRRHSTDKIMNNVLEKINNHVLARRDEITNAGTIIMGKNQTNQPMMICDSCGKLISNEWYVFENISVKTEKTPDVGEEWLCINCYMDYKM